MEALIVDDHPLMQEILSAMLKKAAGRVTVRVATDIESALEQAKRRSGPDLVLLDLGLPGCSGIEALARFRTACTNVKVAVVSSNDNPDVIRAALKAGAAGYIPKTYKPKAIVAVLQIIAGGGTFVPSEILRTAPSGGKHPELSERQDEVLRLLLRGLSNRDMAAQLNIAESTIKHHLHEIYDTLGVSTRTEAMAAAQRRGLQPGR